MYGNRNFLSEESQSYQLRFLRSQDYKLLSYWHTRHIIKT